MSGDSRSLTLSGKGNPERTLVFLLAMAILTLGMPQQSSARPKHVTSSQMDADYVSALSVADRLLVAWQTRDYESGLLLLTDAAKHGATEEALQSFFSGDSDRMGFLIAAGKRSGPRGYEFAVTLLETDAGRRARHRFSHIVVIRAGKDDWAVDKLP